MEAQIHDWNNRVLYAGIALHKNKWGTSVRTNEVLLITFVTEPDIQVLLKTFQHRWREAKINSAYEDGCFRFHLSDFLNSNNIQTQIIAPHTIPTAPGSFTKTDMIDRNKIAFELSKGSIKGIYHRKQDDLFNRHLLRKRRQLVKRRRQLQVQIKADLLFFGIETSFLLKGYGQKKL